MRRLSALPLVTAWLLVAQSSRATASAQQAVAEKCNASLVAPTKDSVRLRVALQIHANREVDLPASFRQDLAEGIREHLVLPTPLGMDAYEVPRDSTRRH